MIRGRRGRRLRTTRTRINVHHRSRHPSATTDKDPLSTAQLTRLLSFVSSSKSLLQSPGLASLAINKASVNQRVRQEGRLARLTAVLLTGWMKCRSAAGGDYTTQRTSNDCFYLLSFEHHRRGGESWRPEARGGR